MVQFRGKGASNGVASGPVYFYQRVPQHVEHRTDCDPTQELARFNTAKEQTSRELGELYDKTLAQAGAESAALFEAHQMILEDLDYIESIEEQITQDHVNAEAAVSQTSAQFQTMFANMEDEYMQARAADIRDISDRVLRALCGVSGDAITFSAPVILAADDLTPSETIQLDRTKILGFITGAGSTNSHTAILARTLGIPAIVDVGAGLSDAFNGQEIFLDGQTGEAFIQPDTQTRERLIKKQHKEHVQRELMDKLRGEPNVTLDGRNIMVYCNIGNPSDIGAVLQNDGGGIGLFRSEFLYMQSNDYPSEDVQFSVYREAAERMCGKRVIIRTLDIGADKQASYFQLDKEENPAMGLRAIRICLSRPEVFRTQLRALYRASAYGKIAIMFPMITSLWEVQEIKRICASVQRELKQENIPMAEYVELGIMIETPAAVMISAELAKQVDFFSIGTNDLTQYTLAVDRQSRCLDRYFDPHHPAVLRMIKLTADNAHKAGIWVGICGELGADLELLEYFLAMDIDELSVSPAAVLPLRNAIRQIDSRVKREALLAALQ